MVLLKCMGGTQVSLNYVFLSILSFTNCISYVFCNVNKKEMVYFCNV